MPYRSRTPSRAPASPLAGGARRAGPGSRGAAGAPAEASEPRIAVVIPCFDEAATIGKVVRDFAAALPRAQVVVFDNNSTDGSGEIARAAGAQVIASPLQGKGNVLRHMARALDADVYVLVDGDDTYPASAAPDLVARLRRDDLDMLVGARLAGHEEGAFRRFHHEGNRLISRLISLLFRTRLSDVLSGYRVLSREFVRIVPIRMGGFEVETEMTLQALSKRLRVAEVPVPYRRRPPGSASKLSTSSDGLLILRCIVLLFKDYRPLVFFGALGAGFALASLLAGIAPIRDYIESRYVHHVPLAILAAGLAILSTVCLTAGLILDTISRLHQETIDLWRRQLREPR
jgi:hypothetical protein